MTDDFDDRAKAVPAPRQAQAPPPSTEFRDPTPEWDPEEVHLRDYLDVLLRRKWLVINALLLTFVTTLIITLAQPKLYQASATLEVAPKDQKVTKFEEISESGIASREFYETQVQLLQSREMARRVAQTLDLRHHPVVADLLFSEKAPGLMARAKGAIKNLVFSFIPKGEEAPENPGVVDEATLEEARLVNFVSSNLTVTPSRTAMLIEVAFLSPDRKLSQSVVNGLTHEFVQWQMEKKMDASDLARGFLMKQIDRAKISLEQAEEELNRFAQVAGIVSLDSRQNSILGQLENLNSALAQAEAEMISRRAIYQQAIKDGPSVLPEVMNSALISQLKGEYAGLQAEYENLSVTFKDDYPAVRALLGRMRSIENRIGQEEQKIFETVRNRYEAAAEQVAALKERAAAQQQAAMDLNERATQYKIMAREVETNKQIYQSLLERSRELESMAGISSSNIHIVDAARLPILPAKPDVRRNLLLALVLGLFAGVGLAFFLEYFTDQIANPDEITDRFQIPILGVVPLAKAEDGNLDKAFVNQPQSFFAEALRTTKVSLQLSGAGRHTRSFVVTSTRPEEGKTTLAANLAMSFAAGGERVVIVDADLRRPRLHQIFGENGANTDKGLSTFLAGAGEDISQIVKGNGVPGVSFLASGPRPPNPVELLASQRFGQLIQQLGEDFDRVIVDGPPMQGFADTLVVSRHVGGVVLVCSSGETTRESLKHFKKSVLGINGTILGCIINKVNLNHRYGYPSYYKYFGYHKYYEDGGKKGDSRKRISG
ncbi:MAG: polysaccharide biosynthesis tyrosine autokinase [Desulfobacteraceae bacterium]|nr:polysaccharide biosynthesis tyrosine autokinase [Desulfobacteraceae bacterium]